MFFIAIRNKQKQIIIRRVLKMKKFDLKKILMMSTLCAALLFTACGGKPADVPTDGTNSAGGATSDTLKVAMECAYAPYNWTQPTDANGAVKIKDSSDFAYGYDVEMAKIIAEKLGKKLEIVKLDWDSLVPAVQSGTVDCVIAGQSITAKRMVNVDFTTPYYYASVVALTMKDSNYANAKSVADLTGATCTSQLNTIWYDICLPQIKDSKILPAHESAPAMLVALKANKCDLVVTDMPTAMAACVAYPDMVLLDFSKNTATDADFKVSEEEINIGISLKKGNTELQTAINEVLATMTPEDFTKMMDAAIAVQPLSK